MKKQSYSPKEKVNIKLQPKKLQKDSVWKNQQSNIINNDKKLIYNKSSYPSLKQSKKQSQVKLNIKKSNPQNQKKVKYPYSNKSIKNDFKNSKQEVRKNNNKKQLIRNDNIVKSLNINKKNFQKQNRILSIKEQDVPIVPMICISENQSQNKNRYFDRNIFNNIFSQKELHGVQKIQVKRNQIKDKLNQNKKTYYFQKIWISQIHWIWHLCSEDFIKQSKSQRQHLQIDQNNLFENNYQNTKKLVFKNQRIQHFLMQPMPKLKFFQKKEQQKDNQKNQKNYQKKQPKKLELSKQKRKNNEKVEQKQIPLGLICPITQQIMYSPMIVIVCGHTFDQKFIKQWLQKENSCPLCKKEANSTQLIKNFAIASMVEQYRKQDK